MEQRPEAEERVSQQLNSPVPLADELAAAAKECRTSRSGYITELLRYL